MKKRITKAAVNHAKEILRLYAEQNPNESIMNDGELFKAFEAGFIADIGLGQEYDDFHKEWCKKEYEEWCKQSKIGCKWQVN